ncbi:hypothetical protein ACFOEK_21200, partial [Litoribrevibacter euphylliae]
EGKGSAPDLEDSESKKTSSESERKRLTQRFESLKCASSFEITARRQALDLVEKLKLSQAL